MSSKSTTLRARSSPRTARRRARRSSRRRTARRSSRRRASGSSRTRSRTAPRRLGALALERGTAAPFFGGARPSAASSCRTSLSASSASYTAKPRRYGSSGPRRSMSLRSIERQSEWKVPIVTWSAAAGPRSAVMASRSSRAALFVKVTREHARRRHALGVDQVGDPRGEHARLARAGARREAHRAVRPQHRRTAAAGSSRAAGRAARARAPRASAAGSAAGAAPGKGGGRRAPRRFLRFSSFRSAVAGARASSSSRRWSRVFCAWHGLHSACRLVSPWPPPSASGTMWSTS